jgi:hypothetical protein
MATKKKQAKKQAQYIRRLAENEYVQKQLRDAANALTKAYQRVTRHGGQTVEDKKFYGHLREAATSIRNLTGALQRRKPEPEPKRRGRKLIAITAAGSGGALLLRRRSSQNDSSDASNSEAGAAATADASRRDAQAPAPSTIKD